MRKLAAIAVMFSLSSSAAYAQKIDYDALDKEGYGDIAEMLRSMTPQERASVLEEAGAKQEDLQKLSPEQLDHLDTQLHKEAGTIDFQKVDPEKLNTSKTKPTPTIMKDLNTYQQKYDEGKIDNAVIKPPPADGQ